MTISGEQDCVDMGSIKAGYFFGLMVYRQFSQDDFV
jgi:hypothetical protein